MNEELLKKEFYIIKCEGYIYYVQPVHIIGFGGCSGEEKLHYILDIKDSRGKYEEMYMYQLEQYKTYKEAQKEVDRLNNINNEIHYIYGGRQNGKTYREFKKLTTKIKELEEELEIKCTNNRELEERIYNALKELKTLHNEDILSNIVSTLEEIGYVEHILKGSEEE